MKKATLFTILIAFIFTADAQVKFDALTFTPQMPKATQTVSFKFNATLSSLIDEKKVDVVVYLFSKEAGYKAVEPKILQAGKTYSGNFKLDNNTACIAFGFSANDNKLKDANGGKGYIVPVYASNNQPVREYYIWAGRLNAGFGEDLLGMGTDVSKNLALLEEGLKLDPTSKNDNAYLSSYLNAVNSVKKKDAEPVILAELKAIETKLELTEIDYGTLAQWYTRLKMKDAADSLTTVMKGKFPEGNWKMQEATTILNKEKDPTKKLALYQEYIVKHPPTADNKRLIDNYKWSIANAYAKAKDYAAYNKWNNELDKGTIASNNNNTAWNMAEMGDNIGEAKKMSLSATTYAKNEMLRPTEKKPESLTTKQWDKRRKLQYAMYADTYAFILYKTGEYKTGFEYAKEAAKINENKDADYNERYSQLLEKVKPMAIAKKEIEQFVRDGAASTKSKEILKTLYVKEKGSDAGYDEYISKLEMAAKTKKRAELAKTMINEVAPKFKLKDMGGNDISLDELKGKVVVMDFWATWCGPCIASMPAMNTVQQQLSSRDDVAFIFIDTWETVENKKQNATDFMEKKKYPFHVLLDDENKVVTDYKVNGIPTKFIIDKTGNIRFKSVGFDGDEALIDEVNMMVDMASAPMPAKKYVK